MFAFCLRIYLAGLLVYAAIHKINHPKESAGILAGHELLPYRAVNLTAISLPWLELISDFFSCHRYLCAIRNSVCDLAAVPVYWCIGHKSAYRCFGNMRLF